jgi:hypothetical protein
VSSLGAGTDSVKGGESGGDTDSIAFELFGTGRLGEYAETYQFIIDFGYL